MYGKMYGNTDWITSLTVNTIAITSIITVDSIFKGHFKQKL